MAKKIDSILANALVQKGMVTRTQMDIFLEEAESLGETLQTVLLRQEVLSEKDILVVLAGELRLPYIQLRDLTIERSILDRVPIKIASYYEFVPLAISGRVLTIAVAVVPDIRIKDEIRIQLGYEIEAALTARSDIREMLEKWGSLGPGGLVTEHISLSDDQGKAAAVESSSTAKTGKSVKRLLGDILLKKGLITPERLALALGEQVTTKELLGTIVVRKGWVKERDLLAALSDRFNMPVVDLKNKPIDWGIIRDFSSALIFDCHCIPFKRDERSVSMAITNPLDAWTIARAEEESTGLILELALTSQEDMEDAIKRYQQYLQKRIL